MGKAEWGVDPEFFGPRHAHRERRIADRLRGLTPSNGLHLECAAGVGSLSFTLAKQGKTVVACDMSLRSLGVVASKARTAGATDRVLPVLADITQLPFVDETFRSASTAETLEHIADHQTAIGELSRVLEVGGTLAGTVPAGPEQWTDWDDWAGHLRRYTRGEMQDLLRGAGFEPSVTTWGWPVVRLYDGLFLTRINRRRLQHQGTVDDDTTLSAVSSMGKNRLLVQLVKAVFGVDKVFDGAPWGVGLLFSGRKSGR